MVVIMKDNSAKDVCPWVCVQSDGQCQVDHTSGDVRRLNNCSNYNYWMHNHLVYYIQPNVVVLDVPEQYSGISSNNKNTRVAAST